jgi:hypothetical protein
LRDQLAQHLDFSFRLVLRAQVLLVGKESLTPLGQEALTTR